MARTTVLGPMLALLLLTSCAEEFNGRPPVRDALHYPIAALASGEDGLLFVLNANFDLAYRKASLVAIDLATHTYRSPFLALDSFPGDLLIATLSSGKRFGYVAVRGNNSLTWFALEGRGRDVELVCNSVPAAAETCGGDHVLVDGVLGDADTGDLVETDMGSDPFALAFLPGDGEERPDRLVVAAMNDGLLSLFDLDPEHGTPVLAAQRDLPNGLHSAAVDPATGIIYLTNKLVPALYRFQVSKDDGVPDFEQLSSVTLPAPFSTGQFGRGIALAGNGRYVLVTYRTPDALLVVDTADARAELSQEPVKLIPLTADPGHVRVLPTGPAGSEQAFVACYNDDSVWVVDLDNLVPVQRIEVGAGPYDISAWLTDGTRRGYVNNFLDHTVSVIDLEPDSPYYQTVIAEIR